MEKILFGAVLGIFVGAVAVEILNRKKPELTRGIEKKAKKTVAAYVAAFKEGLEVDDGKTKLTQPEQSPA